MSERRKTIQYRKERKLKPILNKQLDSFRAKLFSGKFFKRWGKLFCQNFSLEKTFGFECLKFVDKM